MRPSTQLPSKTTAVGELLVTQMRPLLILLFLAAATVAQQEQTPDLTLTAADQERLIEAEASRIEHRAMLLMLW